MPKHNIIPLNEGQDLNYHESFDGTLRNAKIRAEKIIKGLKSILIQGDISCKIEKYINGSGWYTWLYSGSEWEKEE